MSNSRFARSVRPQRPGELIDDGSFQCCVRIGRSCLLCGQKSSHFPYTWFVGPDWYCMCVTYILIIVPTVLFIRNVAVYYGAPIIVVAVVLCAVTLGFFSMTACSDPGIVFEVKEFESTHHDEEHDVEMIAGLPNQSQPYSPIRSTDLIHHDAPDHIDEPDLLNTSNEGGIVDIEGGDASNGYRNQDVHSSELAKVPINNTTTPAHTHVVDSVANRIVVGAAQRASRGAHLSHSSSSSSNSSNILANTPINAPYLPPPTKIECGRCQLMRPRDASHCHDCGVCVKKLDHHCPWTGKCIGEKTLRTFYAFLISLCVLIAFVVIVVVVAFAQSKDIFNFHRVR